MPFFQTPSCFLKCHLSHTFRSFTTSFVFPSCPVGMITSHRACRRNLQILHYIQTYMHTYIHTTFSHTIFLCHTRSFTYNFVPHNSFNFSILHHLLCLSCLPRPATTFVAHGPHTTYHHTTSSHTTCSHTTSSHTTYSHTGSLLHTPILHHLFSLSCISHAIFTFLLLLVGRSWHVGLSGPLIWQHEQSNVINWETQIAPRIYFPFERCPACNGPRGNYGPSTDCRAGTQRETSTGRRSSCQDGNWHWPPKAPFWG